VPQKVSSALETRKRLRNFKPEEDPRASRTLAQELERARKVDSSVDVGEALKRISAKRPDLANQYLAESRGAQALTRRRPNPTDVDDLWDQMELLWSGMSPDQRAGAIAPAVARQWLRRSQPVLLLDDQGDVVGTSGDELLGRKYGTPASSPVTPTRPSGDLGSIWSTRRRRFWRPSRTCSGLDRPRLDADSGVHPAL
jgi:hypothetical protein